MPRRGEVWLVDLGMAQKTRPAVILSVEPGDTDRVVVTVVSHTTSLREGAFAVQSITTIPTKHALRRLGSLTPKQLAPIEKGVREWLKL